MSVAPASIATQAAHATPEPARAETLERVILVDRRDVEIGAADKLHAHAAGLLHRAFSILVFDARGALLLQQRAAAKYHSGGLWSNTCCGHPRPGEDTPDAAARRLTEEMGFRCGLAPLRRIAYRAALDNGLVEHEYLHVYRGRWDGDPSPDAAEVMMWRWVEPQALAHELARAPETFTPWFRLLARAGALAAPSPGQPRDA